MSPHAFEEQLRKLDEIASPVRRRAGRDTWRFVFNDKPYYLHFYPHSGSRFSSSNAAREFAGLKTLQDFKLPAVRVAAMLSGFKFAGQKGDAIIVHGVEPAERLDTALKPENHRELLLKTLDLLQAIGKAGVGHADLKLSSFLVTRDGRVLVLDGVGIAGGGLSTEHLMRFAHSAGPLLSRVDRVRAWRALVPNSDEPPPDSRRVKRFWADAKRDETHRVRVGEWSGEFRVRNERPLPWSVASHLELNELEWQREWPRLLEMIQSDQLEVLKRDISGDVLAGQINLTGRPIDVVIKRPRNKFWYRYVVDAFRASRAARIFKKARWLLSAGLPIEFPLLLMEKRVMGYAVDAVAIFERVPGVSLDVADLSLLRDREGFFRACGRTLRRIEQAGLSHMDAKSSNWIVYDNCTPVLIDPYGIRVMTAFRQLNGLRRLLRAMKNHPQYTPEDSLHLCQGYAPRATTLFSREGQPDAH